MKQLVVAFSPDNQLGFKQVVLVDDSHRGLALGFLTKEFTLGDGVDAVQHVAVYVPTNHIYFGDIHIYPTSKLLFPDLTVQEGVQIFLTGGMAMREQLRVQRNKLTGTSL